MPREISYKYRRDFWPRHKLFLCFLTLFRQLRLKHLCRRGALEKLFVIDEYGLENFEVVGHRPKCAVATKTFFPSRHSNAIWIVDDLSSFFISNGHACHAALHFRMLLWPKCDILDIQRLPDVQLHVLLQRLARNTFDQLTSPVNTGAVEPASAGLIDERMSVSLFYCSAGSYLETLCMLAIALEALAHR